MTNDKTFQWAYDKQTQKIFEQAKEHPIAVELVLDELDKVMYMTFNGKQLNDEQQAATAASIIMHILERFDKKGQAMIIYYLNKNYYATAKETDATYQNA